MPRFFNPLFGGWISDETLFLVFDISRKGQKKNIKARKSDVYEVSSNLHSIWAKSRLKRNEKIFSKRVTMAENLTL